MSWKALVFPLLILLQHQLCIGQSDYVAHNLTEEEELELNRIDELFASCQVVGLEPGEYIIFGNGTAFVEGYKRSYNSSFYWLKDGILSICAPTEDFKENMEKTGIVVRYHVLFYYLTRICLGVSIVCLLLHLIAFYLVEELRNLPGYCLISLCVSLLLFYTLFLVTDSEVVESSGNRCVVLATMSYFLILSSFMWMATMGFDVFRSLLNATGKLRLSSKNSLVKRFVIYSIFCYGVSLVFVTAALLMDNMRNVPEDYRPKLGTEQCWFGGRKALLILFGGPVFTVIAANVLFFCASAYVIYVNRLQTAEMDYRTTLKKNFTLHYRLATIMGLTWIVGIANFTQNFTLLTIYVFLSSLQGFFIFLACSCTAKVRNNIKQRLGMRDRKVSAVSTVATFQSYCNEDFSMEPEVCTTAGKESDCTV